mmetsp:Transcript_39089/g.62425  ORF Transcript_39089/g.62425 Transcript_39089/m.62425 type:complete len:239 (+) Transcript_39089:121-837(+)
MFLELQNPFRLRNHAITLLVQQQKYGILLRRRERVSTLLTQLRYLIHLQLSTLGHIQLIKLGNQLLHYNLLIHLALPRIDHLRHIRHLTHFCIILLLQIALNHGRLNDILSNHIIFLGRQPTENETQHNNHQQIQSSDPWHTAKVAGIVIVGQKRAACNHHDQVQHTAAPNPSEQLDPVKDDQLQFDYKLERVVQRQRHVHHQDNQGAHQQIHVHPELDEVGFHHHEITDTARNEQPS